MCRAWVNFNGTGTVAIRASGNVSYITDVAVGKYTINFITAMPSADYAWSFAVDIDTAAFPTSNTYSLHQIAVLTTSLQVGVVNTAGAAIDADLVCVTIIA
jgi:hypothetical protein